MTKLLKFSPRRDALFDTLKKELSPDTVCIRVLCPTRGTVRADALSSILANYSVLMQVWEEAKGIARDAETFGRINGVSAYMENLSFIFEVVLGKLNFGHSDNLSKSLQVKTLRAAKLTVKTLQSIRSEEMFDLFWGKVIKMSEDLGVNSPILPRQHKRP